MNQQGILTGCPKWADVVWRKNAPRIYKECNAWSDTSEAAEDLFQDVALKFCQNVSRLDCSRDLSHWFTRVIRTSHYDQYRRRRQGTVMPMSVLAEGKSQYQVFPLTPDAQNPIREKIVCSRLSDLMTALNPAERMIVEYNLIAGVPVRDICDFLGICGSTVRKHRQTAVRKMQKKKNRMLLSAKICDGRTIMLEDLLTR